MGSVWDFLQGAAASVREGMTLRERVRDVTAVDTTINTRTFTMRVVIPVRELEELLEELGPEQDEAIATILASMVREEFLTVLASMDSDDVG
jgi:ABC-type sulfate transport system permease subunit